MATGRKDFFLCSLLRSTEKVSVCGWRCSSETPCENCCKGCILVSRPFSPQPSPEPSCKNTDTIKLGIRAETN